jgi:hypothetical protein
MNRPGSILVRPLSAALAFAMTLAACSAAAPSGSPLADATSVSSSPLASAAATGSTSPGESEDPEESLPPFACNLPIHLAATTPRAQITDVRLGTHTTYDRLVVDFAAGVPEVTLEKARPPLTQDASGLPIAVEGTSFLRLILNGGTTQLLHGGTSYGGERSFQPHFATLLDVEFAGDFEAVSSWYLGLDGDACVRVLTLTNPDRLVVDLQH